MKTSDHMRTGWLLVLLVLGFRVWADAQASSTDDPRVTEQAMKSIRPEAIRAHMRFLSDSLLAGRDPGTPGFDIAARYVASEFEAMELKPAGADGSWYQPVPLRKAVVDAAQSSVVLMVNGKKQELKDAVDYVFDGNVASEDSSVESGIVFAGFGVTAPELNYDDYAGLDVRGKIVAVLSNAPARFSSTERAYYSDSVIKNRNAVARGAVGMMHILTPEDEKREPWNWLVPQYQSGDTKWLDEQGVPHDAFPELRVRGLFSRHGADLLFAGAPKTLDQVFATARASQPQGFALPVAARIRVVSRPDSFESSNIVAMLPGSDPKLREQYVVYSAHLDHLGLCPAVDGDKVCHGAYDNASGVASVLEVARAFASLPRPPRRSVIFLIVTGEESDLLGSEYFTFYPTVPRRAIVADINIDGAPGILYPIQEIVPLGIEHSSLDRDVEQAARQMGYGISPDPMPEENMFVRSDQYSFVLQGIPAVNINDGMRSTDPKVNGLEVTKTWLTTIYHTPRDNMNQDFKFEPAARGAGLNFLVGYEIAQDDAPPQWNPNDFFGGKFGAARSGGKRW